jgi:hypothetical protein
MYEELSDQPLNVLIDFWFGEPPVEAEYADSFFEETAYEISRQGADGATFLAKQMQVEGQTRFKCLIGGLSMADLPIEQRKVLIRPFLLSKSPAERAEAIRSFCYFRDQDVRRLIEPQIADDDIYVRVAALTYMGKVFPLESVDLMLLSLSDSVWNIRSSAIDQIDELEDTELAAQFSDRIWPFLEDPHHYVRDTASWYLIHHVWDEQGISEIGAQIEQESDPRRTASLIRLAGDRRESDLVQNFILDQRPVVQLAAIDELVSPWGSVLAALKRDPKFIEKCANDPDPRVRDMVPELEEQLHFELRLKSED